MATCAKHGTVLPGCVYCRAHTEPVTFTPEAVRGTLLATGFDEYERGLEGKPGFHMGDGRDTRGEILVEYRAGRIYQRPGDDETRMRYEEAYEAALSGAGFQVHIDMRYVIVTGLDGED